MTALNTLATLVVWSTRYHPHTTTGGLLATFVRSIVASLGWHAGTSLARLLGSWLVVLAVLAIVLHLWRSLRRLRRSFRRVSRTGRRSTGRGRRR